MDEIAIVIWRMSWAPAAEGDSTTLAGSCGAVPSPRRPLHRFLLEQCLVHAGRASSALTPVESTAGRGHGRDKKTGKIL